ncbi:hypothetical protein EYS42_07135 [Aquabacterium lacunae]|uniref:DUF2235 domain-containing protein n=1 Tax=Aquabacterium lacunae TaxID=2528630 RepID=A0A4Q9H1A3_9BURK|nr:DUF2235 domain-containing protein [Aquabacterium lacunae]TBO32928.1 hypothetical protein EYS42_07135 [Aquabacterium lacunae]
MTTKRFHHNARQMASWLLSLACIGHGFHALAQSQVVSTSSSAATTPSSTCGPGNAGATGCGSSGPATTNVQQTNSGAGQPFNVLTGNKYQLEQDMPALPGVLGLELVRHYNSVQSTPNMPNGLVGLGWRLSYETRLHAKGRNIEIVQADGSRLGFAPGLLNPEVCSSALPEQGRVLIDKQGTRTRYTWVWANGRRLQFNQEGLLEQIAAPTGEFVTLQHDRRGLLVQVTDPQGRSLKLNYLDRKDNDGTRFSGVQSIDTPVGRFEYQYGTGAQVSTLMAVRLPTAYQADKPAHPLTSRGTTLSSVTRHYHHEDPRHPTLLTGISVQGNGSDGKPQQVRLTRFAYDERGLGQRNEHGGRVLEVKQLERAGLREDVEHPSGLTVLAHSQTAERPQGLTLKVYGSQVAGHYRIVRTEGAPCPSHWNCPAANRSYRYDDRGRLVEETERTTTGTPVRSERYTYDPLGRLLRVGQWAWRTPGQGAPVERHYTRYVYGPDVQATPTTWQPVLIAEPSVINGLERKTHLRYNDVGQVVEVRQEGYSPLTRAGQVAQSPEQATPLSRSIQISHAKVNGRSVLVAVDGPLPGADDTTRYVWDARGNQVISIQAPLGLKHSFTHDEAGRIRTEVPSDGVPVHHSHLPTGEPSSWQRGEARVTVTRDALARPVRIEMPDGEVQKLAYEPQSGAVASVRQDGAMHWVVPPSTLLPAAPQAQALEPQLAPPWQGQKAWVDDFGRLVALQTAVTGLEVRQFDANGRMVERKLADGTVWRWQRDALGRIVRHEASKAGEASLVTTLAYQGVHLVRITHPQESEHMQHDALGRVVLKTIERAATATQPAQRWSERFAYDVADRLTRHELPEGGALLYTWGPGRQLQRIDMEDGRLSAVLGTTLAQWLGLGRQTLIEPLPEGTPPTTKQAQAAAQPTAPGTLPASLQAQLQAERGYRWGNGVAVRWRLNAQGQLASLRYSAPTQQVAWWQPLWDSLPMATAQASKSAGEAASQPTAPTGTAPAGMDWAYTYDPWGRLISKGDTHYAYDTAGRLLVAQQNQGQDPAATDFYAYGTGAQGEQMLASRTQGQNHDWRTVAIARNASGLPLTITQGGRTRALRYNPDHRLIEVSQNGQLLARYGHNTHGQRISKLVGPQTPASQAQTFLWSQGQLSAEGHGQAIDRRYVYAHGVPVAVIDHPGGASAITPAEGPWSALLQWAQAVWRVAATPAPQLTYLHSNEIGTPVAATGARGQLLWQAEHSAFGELRALRTEHRPGHAPQGGVKGFALNLRLPGQYFDAETSWHDNVLRTYDPQRGQYLEPDPLGPTPNWGRGAGPWLTQPFAYANHNPITYADPTGLILFAFDGTNNSNPPPGVDDFSNVYKFYLAYDQEANGRKWYMNGIGRDDPDSKIFTNLEDQYNTNTARARVDYMVAQFEEYMKTNQFKGSEEVNIDMVGFSRGAAMARDFSNRIASKLNGGYYSYDTGSQCASRKVNLRFLGLWDTVAQFGANGAANGFWQLAVPAEVQHAFHAVAMNENRYLFPGEAIGRGVQRGFVGMHADIGGSYGTGDLSDVALNWIVDQAKGSGVAMKDWQEINHEEWGIVTNPVVHGKGFDLMNSDFCLRANNEVWATNCTLRKNSNPGGLTTKQIADQGFITYSDKLGKDADGSTPIDGTVNMEKYAKWLKDNYNLTVAYQ